MLLKRKEFKENKNILKFLLTLVYELMYTSPCKKLRPDEFNIVRGVFIFRRQFLTIAAAVSCSPPLLACEGLAVAFSIAGPRHA